MSKNMRPNEFGFGIEAELLLVERDTFHPLGYRDLDLQTLLRLVDDVPTADITRNGFNQKPLHNQASPYLIEGYTLTDQNMQPIDLLPKGIEIRTPLASSFDQATDYLNDLYERLKVQLLRGNMDAAIISYHPSLPRISAPRNYQRHDYWQWALTATTTYGPDINISLPEELNDKVDLVSLNARVNYYGPAAVALTLASPIQNSQLWKIKGGIGKSVRTFERSQWAPLIYVHETPSLYFEFKGFEMSRCLQDYHALFLIWLALLLDNSLDQTESDETRIANLQAIAIHGLSDPTTRHRAAQVLRSAEFIGQELNLPTDSLKTFWQRLKTQRLPADQIIETFAQTNSVENTLRSLTDFIQCQPIAEITETSLCLV